MCAALAAYVCRLAAVRDATVCVLSTPRPPHRHAACWERACEDGPNGRVWWDDEFKSVVDLCSDSGEDSSTDSPRRLLDGADSSDARLLWRVARAARLYSEQEALATSGLADEAGVADVRASMEREAAKAARTAESALAAMEGAKCQSFRSWQGGLTAGGDEIQVNELVALFDPRSARYVPCFVKCAEEMLSQGRYCSPVADDIMRRYPRETKIKMFFFYECFDPEATKLVKEGCERRQLAYEKNGLPSQCLKWDCTRHAAQREIALLSGIPIDEDGEQFVYSHPWFTLAARVGSPEWFLHLQERREAVAPGELRAYWHDQQRWLSKGLNLRPSLIVSRALHFCRKRSERQRQVGQHAPRRNYDLHEAPGAFYFLEAFCGTAILSREFLRQAEIERKEKLDWDVDDEGEGEGDDGGLGITMYVQALDWTGTEGHGTSLPMSQAHLDQLGAENLLCEDWLNLDLNCMEDSIRLSAPRSVGRDQRERVLDQVHFGFECRTFSNLAMSIHQRYIDNNFSGTSHDAYEANVRLFHAIAFCFLMRYRNPQVGYAVRLCARVGREWTT